MSLINLIAGTLLALILAGALAALVVLCHSLAPAAVARTQATAERMPVRAFVVGLINFVFFGLLAAAAGRGGEIGGLVALIILTILLCFVALGLTASARLVGARLRPDDRSPVRRLLVGIATLEAAALVPIVGWIAVPALAGLIGYGALIIVLLRRRGPRPSTASPPLPGDAPPEF